MVRVRVDRLREIIPKPPNLELYIEHKIESIIEALTNCNLNVLLPSP